ncbi:superfamily II DNA/RNA helicase [Isoptericola jiangsuensis]|uniref:RNA helicase n=1 Tax=Isoptericola jiangsuensis TaxID=548579 RepID=A0A2A9EVS3_9MICO|nr:DEAD/DEAH box helicase [Isoptericola jiangsuensis]PFG42380.1 superfamily II DNA/RNA helicase [Isoptericola jiangsuensis]
MTTTDTAADDATTAPATTDTPDFSTPAAIQAQDVSFADFGVREEIVDALRDAGITHPFPIQAMTLPVALQGHDIIGQAKTGTGKTLGFGVPLLHRVAAPGEPEFDALPAPGKPQALVVAPTRELAVQVANDLQTASKHRGVRIVQIYGGRAYEPQIEALNRGAEVVVGTPGRMVDLLNQGHLNLTRAATVVLDEADEMLDLGFLPDVEKILARTPAVRHTMLFSATMPGAVVSMARRYMKQPTHIRAADPDDDGATVKNTRQVVYRAHALDKIEVLARILQSEGRGRTIVFTRTKRTAAKVSDELRDRGFAAGALHGDLGQGAREQALRALRHGHIDVLVATDVAARGIDVDDVTHVVNYQCPEDERTYLHRIGRTGRAGNKGTAVTFVDWDDVPRWQLIDRTLDLGFPEPVETYSSSPHLYSDLGIPEGTKGRLPKAKQELGGLDAEVLEDLGETGKRTGSSSPSRGGSRSGGRDGGRGGQRDGGRSRGGQGQRSGGQERSGGERATGAPAADKPAGEGSGEAQRRRRRRRTRSGRPDGQGTPGAQGGAPAPGTD